VTGVVHDTTVILPGQERKISNGWDARWGPRDGMKAVEKRKIALPFRESNTNPSDVLSIAR
jgi:hypothetical protein